MSSPKLRDSVVTPISLKPASSRIRACVARATSGSKSAPGAPALDAPARGEDVGVDEVGWLRLRAILEYGGDGAIANSLLRDAAGAYAAQKPAPRIGTQGVAWNRYSARQRRRVDVDTVGDPASAVRRLQERRITHAQPQQATERVAETADGVPGSVGARRDAQSEPPIPRKILELDRAREDRGEEPRL